MIYFFLIVTLFTFFSHGMDSAPDAVNSTQTQNQEKVAEKKQSYAINIDITTTIVNRTKKIGNRVVVMPQTHKKTTITARPLK